MVPDVFTANGVTYTKQEDGRYLGSNGQLKDASTAAAIYATVADQLPAQGKLPGAPTIKFGTNGEAWRWDGGVGDFVRDTRFDEAPQAQALDQNLGGGVFQDEQGTYVEDRVPAPGGRGGTVAQKRYITDAEARSITNPKAPSAGRAPTQPTTYDDPLTGDVVGVNPFTGAEVFRIPGATYAQLSPQQQRQIDIGDLAAARQYSTSERVAGQQYASGENALNRQQTSQENSIDRAMNASQFAANYGIDSGRFNLQREQELAAQQRNIRNDSLNAAEQYASLVSLTDPAALPAFLQAGGGNIGNALARGVDALSNNALLPAARSLQAAEAPIRPTVSFGAIPDYNPFLYSPGQFGFTGFGNRQPPIPQPSPQQQPGPIAQAFTGLNNQPEQDLAASLQAGGADPAQIAAYQQIAAQQAAQAASTGRSLTPQGGITRMAQGGTTNATMMKVGEEGMEGIINPTGAPIAVVPNEMMGGMKGAQGYADGTLDPGDIPFVDRVRMLRQSVDTSDPLGVGPFDTRFSFLAPSLQQRSLAGKQTRFGIPIQDQQAEINRYALQGVNRGQFAFGL